ncbi:MAG: hypothetical protein QOK29_754 [Rhodospirillaceae bacterium]|jgi:CheY-like chemotaxis protein|nr:hypothetical protein [Rhodospirillaceae bacterium]
MEQRTGRTGCTILLVDDDPLISMSTAEMLMDLGHQVVEASSGSMALEILRAGTKVDVVMTDQAMPGMTGVELAAQIRASWPSVAIILATGYAELPKGSGLELPQIDKPYSHEDLADAIGRLTAGKVPS